MTDSTGGDNGTAVSSKDGCWDAYDRWDSYRTHLYERSKLQEEVRDRWFRYYLIIVGIIVSVIVLGSRMAEATTGIPGEFLRSLPIIGVSVFWLGVLFFLMQLAQHFNIRGFQARIAIIEDEFLFKTLFSEKTDERLRELKNPIGKLPIWSATVSVGVIFALLNTLLLYTSIDMIFLQNPSAITTPAPILDVSYHSLSIYLFPALSVGAHLLCLLIVRYRLRKTARRHN